MTRDEILTSLKDGDLSVKDAAELLAAMTPVRTGRLICKVSRKGAVSVYGLQQMPVTLYAEQWERLLDGAPDDHFVVKFIRENEGKDFHGSSATTRGGKKEPYTARITRKAA